MGQIVLCSHETDQQDRGGAMDTTLAGIRAMVVDDDPSVLSLMVRLLRHWGFDSVKEAPDGRSALRKAMEIAPEIVFMDVEMPELNGYEASLLLKERFPGVTIILVTGVPDGRLARKALEEGVVKAVLPKPFTFDQLKMLVDEFLKERRGVAKERGAGAVA